MAKAKKRIRIPDRLVIVGAGGGGCEGYVDSERSVIRTKLTLSGGGRDRSVLITTAAASALYYELATLLFQNAVIFRPKQPKGHRNG